MRTWIKASAPQLRGTLVLLHRYIGLSMALFLIVAGLTGSILAFDREIDAWLNPKLFHVDSSGPALSPTQLAQRIEEQEPRVRVTYIPIAFAAGESVQLSVRANEDPQTGRPYVLGFNQLFADPITGRLLGTRQSGAFKVDRPHLIPFIVKLHYSLHLPGQWGLWLFGGAALLWVFDCFIALYLTFPRAAPFWSKWQVAWQVKRKRLNFDLHRAGGVWLFLVLVPLAVSSVYLNLYDEVFKPVVTAFSPLTPSPFDSRPASRSHPTPAYDYDGALAMARAEGPAHGITEPVGAVGYRSERGFYFAIYREGQGAPGAGLGNSRLYFDDQTGAVIASNIPGTGTAADVFTQLQFPLHTGQIAGLAGRILICITGLVVAMLSVTGIVIWLRKRRARAVSRSRSEVEQRYSPPVPESALLASHQH